MPKIPIHNRQLSLTTEPPATRVSVQEAGMQARAMGEIGNVLTQIGQKMDQVRMSTLEDEAKIQATQLTGEADLRAQQEQWSDAYEGNRQKDLDNINKTVMSSIKDPRVAQNVGAWLEMNLTKQRIANKSYGYTKLRKYQENLVDERILSMQDRIIQGKISYEEGIGEIASYLTQKRDLGIMSETDRLKSFKNIKTELVIKQIDYDSYHNPQSVLDELGKKDLGLYKELPKDLIDDYKIKSDNRLKMIENETNLQNKIAIDKREAELTAMKVNKDPLLTPDLVRTEMKTGKIYPSFADSMINNLEKRKEYNPSKLESVIKFNELVERNIEIAKKENSWFGIGKASFDEVTKFRADVFDANTKGYISDSQTSDLLTETSESFYRDPIFQNALRQLASQSEAYTTPEAQARVKAEMYGNLIMKVINGKNPQEAVVEVIKERLAKEMDEVSQSTDEQNPYKEYPDAFNEGGVWKVIRNGKKYKIEE